MKHRSQGPIRVALAVSLLLAAGACANGTHAPWIEFMRPGSGEPVVDRLSDRELRIRWPAVFALGGVTIFGGTSPEAIDREAPLERVRGLQRSVTLRDLDPQKRYYFALVPDSGAPPRIVAERRLPLEGTDNFRDLGGYATSDGRFVRWGRVYRSNALSELTPRDLAYLDDLGIRLVCDFRSPDERLQAPDRTPADPQLDVARLPISVEGVDPNAMRERIRTGRIHADRMQKTMEAAYRAFVTEFGPQYAAMLRRIQDPAHLPSILHCTAGKDRAGFASALVLLALGVPEETVVDDYLLTNDYRADYNRFLLRVVPLYSLLRTRGNDLAPLLEARESYLEAALDTIDAEYGSVDGYLREGLGLDDGLRDRLRDALLTATPAPTNASSRSTRAPRECRPERSNRVDDASLRGLLPRLRALPRPPGLRAAGLPCVTPPLGTPCANRRWRGLI